VTSELDDRHFDIAVVGAGAAGLATAIFARRLNPSRSVALLDSSAKPGAKILVSGGSRCNVTNVEVDERDFSGGKSAIIRKILRAFAPTDVVAWFRSLGVPLHEEARGKLFPDSNRSRDVLNALLTEATASGVVLEAPARVADITRDGEFTLHTVRGPFRAGAVVMATGGLSLPKTGSDGGGLEIVRGFGHTIIPTTPALVPLTSAEDQPLHQALTGVSHEAELALWADGRVARRLRGDLLWTHFGLSGPVVLDMSRHLLRARLEGRDAKLTINFVGGKSFESLEQVWANRATARPRASLHGVLAEMIPAALAAELLARLGIDAAGQVAHLPRDDRRRLIHALVERPVKAGESRGYNYAEATAGGVALDEIDPATMRSRKCAGLYLVGEMLDVDGRIGGFNFQWAWSSAQVAARALAERS
jgi:predicted Rossmann fold flavoprotein